MSRGTDLKGLRKEAEGHLDDTEQPSLLTAGWVALIDAIDLIEENEERHKLLTEGRTTHKNDGDKDSRAKQKETVSHSPVEKSKRDERVSPPGDNPDDHAKRQKGGKVSGSKDSDTRPDVRAVTNEEASEKASKKGKS